MPIATGVAKTVAIKKETNWGVAPGASGAKYMRRVTSDLSLKKQSYESEEMRDDYQVQDSRHGVRSVGGGISGELSCGSYSDFMGSALRRLFTPITAITGVSVTIAASGALWTVTRTTGDYTSVVRVGLVVQLQTGALNASNINKNLLVVAVTPLVMTVLVLNGTQMVAEGPITGVTVNFAGKKTFAPTTGHIDESYAVEHFHSDVSQSELFTGCKVNQITIDLPPTGMSKIKIDFMGKDMTPAGTQYFTSPTAAGTGGVLAAVNGAMIVNGAPVALLTGLNFVISANQTAEPVVGSNTYPDIQEGRIKVSGQMTVMFQDGVFRDYFANETEVAIVCAFSASNSATADFISFSMPRVKINGADKNDGERAIVQTAPFTALLGGVNAANDRTTIMIHDSLAA